MEHGHHDSLAFSKEQWLKYWWKICTFFVSFQLERNSVHIDLFAPPHSSFFVCVCFFFLCHLFFAAIIWMKQRRTVVHSNPFSTFLTTLFSNIMENLWLPPASAINSNMHGSKMLKHTVIRLCRFGFTFSMTWIRLHVNVNVASPYAILMPLLNP